MLCFTFTILLPSSPGHITVDLTGTVNSDDQIYYILVTIPLTSLTLVWLFDPMLIEVYQ